jgi:uncharacterized protein YbcV (DUF1398 family)
MFNEEQARAMRECSAGSIAGRLRFPDVLAAMAAHGVERYMVDYAGCETAFYLPCGAMLRVPAHRPSEPIAATFDADGVARAVLAAQAGSIDYAAFSDRVARAGCAGYHVSLPGRRVVYHGRSGELHVEHFPA